MSKVIVVSGDGHIGAPAQAYREYLDPAFRDRLDDLQREEDEFLASSVAKSRAV